jgi:glyoxylase-like metal-dependent hydrolase (beta-lactamase superfamily II)
MMGLQLPDVDVWSDRVVVALGQNPSVFTGPGTNTYLVGTGAERILLDTGSGHAEYLPVLDDALASAGCRIQEIVLTHGHPDHIGGAASVMERHGALSVSKRPHAPFDDPHPIEVKRLDDGDVVRTEGATLRAIHTPGHAADHLCFLLEEERSLFSGDNVLGVGTTVIPAEGGDLLDYMRSLERALLEEPTVIYPAHGPRIDDGCGKIREYIAHRLEREQQILSALGEGRETIPDMVELIYAAYPDPLKIAARTSVCSHLLKLEREGSVRREGYAPRALEPRVIHPLVARLRDENPQARREACAEAARDPSAVLLVDPLCEALADPEPRVARAASDALVSIGAHDTLVATRLYGALRGASPDGRCWAAFAIARLEPPSIKLLPVLLDGLEREDREIRWSSARLLVELGRLEVEVLPVMLHFVAGDERPRLRRMAVFALRELAPDRPETTRALLAASHSEDPEVRRAALPALAPMLEHTEAARARLLEAREQDPDPESRALAASALRALEDERVE